ncbi:MAG: Fasciclin domain protein [Euryarchaeota archaeon]|nr:Fasciclin domain protein [Euryarchaeota archaeon]
MAAMLCTGMSPAQDSAQDSGAAKTGITDALKELGINEFSTAVDGAGLAGVLNDEGVLTFGSGSFVIFAPSDEAFLRASGVVDMNAIMENPAELKRVLFHHMVWNSGSFDNISEVSTVRTLQGEDLTLNSTDAAWLAADGANVTASQEYDSGIIYVIDRVLLPETDSSMGVADAANDLGAKKFADALKSSGLADTLNGQGLMGIEDLAAGPFTVFAPSDEAFSTAKSSIDAISKKDSGMQNLLSYHVVDAQGLLDITASNSMKTMLGDSLAVDRNLSLVGGANVIGSERFDNGIVYIIDQVLVPISLSM